MTPTLFSLGDAYGGFTVTMADFERCGKRLHLLHRGATEAGRTAEATSPPMPLRSEPTCPACGRPYGASWLFYSHCCARIAP